LNFLSQGCYTSREGNKAGARHSETKLMAAEAAAGVAWRLVDKPYPDADLRDCWQDALFQHFHDILPGCNVQVSREYTSGKHQDVMARTAMTETLSLRRIASRVDTSADTVELEPDRPPMYKRSGMGGGVGHEAGQGRISQYENSAGGWPRHFLVFNPTAVPREEVIGATLWEVDKYVTYFPLERWGERETTKYLRELPFCVRTPSGRRIPAQVLESNAAWMNYYTRLVFPVEPLTGFGYGVYTIFADPPEEEVEGAATATEVSSGWVLQNDGIKVQIDSASGAVHSLIDKAHGTELANARTPMGQIEFVVEEPCGGSAWELGKLGPASKPEIKDVRGTASGPYIARVDVDWQVAESTFTTTYEVRHGDPTLYMELNGFWAERGDETKGIPSIKMAFASGLADPRPCYEIPFGALERAEHDGIEVPALRWAAVTGQADGGTAGLLLLNNAKHGHSLTDGVLRVTLLRSTYDPDPAPEIGLKTMALALRPYSGDLDPAEATRKAIAFNNDLRVVGTEDHAGDLPMAMDGLSVASGTAVVSGFKKADGQDAFVIRLIEYAGQDAQAELVFNETVFGKVKKVETVDLMERPGGCGAANSDGNTVNVQVPAHGIASVMVWL